MTIQINAPQVTALQEMADEIFDKAAAKLKVKAGRPIVQSTVSGPIAVAAVEDVAERQLGDILAKKTPLFFVQAAYDPKTNARDDVLLVTTDPERRTAILQTVDGDTAGVAELEVVESFSASLLPSFGCSVDDISGTIVACCSYMVDLPSISLDGQICVRFTMPRIPLPN